MERSGRRTCANERIAEYLPARQAGKKQLARTRFDKRRTTAQQGDLLTRYGSQRP